MTGQNLMLSNLGVVSRELGRLEDSADYLERAVAAADRDGVDARIVLALNNLSNAYANLGRFEDAASTAFRALEVCRSLENLTNDEASALGALGLARAGQGRNTEAIKHLSDAIELYRATQDPWFECVELVNLGRAYRADGQPDEARTVLRRALVLFDELGGADGFNLVRADVVELIASLPPMAATD